MKKILFLLILSLSLFSKDITLGVVPQQSPLKLSKIWIQVTDYLNKETGLNIIFKTEKSIPDFEQKLYVGEYDIAYMNPYHFIVAQEKQKYVAFARAKKNIEGILVSKEKEVLFSKENLKGKKFLFPAPNAFAATLLTKFELKEKYDIDLDTEAEILYVNSHDSVYKGIARDIGFLGGGIVRTYNNFSDAVDKDKLNIVYKTDSYPSHPFAYNPRVDKEDIKKLEQAFLKMPKELRDLLSIDEFILINSKEFDVIKNLKVKE